MAKPTSQLALLRSWAGRHAPRLFVLVILVALLVSFVVGYDNDLRRDFTSNSLATLLGIAVGIPIGLWVAEHQEQKTEAERRYKVLRLLRSELLVNYGGLAGWGRSGHKELEVSTFSEFERDDVWRAFSDGGELQWIRDPALLGKLAEAYASTRIVRSLADKYYTLIHLGNADARSSTAGHLWQLLEKGIPFAMQDIDVVVGTIRLPGDKASEDHSDQNEPIS